MKKALSLLLILFFAGFFECPTESTVLIDSVIKTCPIAVASVITPSSVQELQTIVRQTKGPISLAGARGSQGGQIAYPGGTVIDMTALSRIISIDKSNKLITVEAGTTWRTIQEAIDPYNLSVRVMQSYNDFTVGGSASVNVHARMISEGPMIGSIEQITIILADGSLVTASRTEHADLFYGAIGGYGLLGIIATITLRLTDNVCMEQRVCDMPSTDVDTYFKHHIQNNPDALFFNAVLYPHSFKNASVVCFYKTNIHPTVTHRLRKPDVHNMSQMIGEQIIKRIPFTAKIREWAQKKYFKKEYRVFRNYEMSAYSIKDLNPITRYFSNSILQEYFIPANTLNQFLKTYKQITSDYGINVLNASIRYVPADTESILNFAPVDSYSIVLYINVWNSKAAHINMKLWTQKLIDAALSVGGTFYLPYHLYATKRQFYKAYPKATQFLQLKKKYDPQNIFKNMLLDTYFIPIQNS